MPNYVRSAGMIEYTSGTMTVGWWRIRHWRSSKLGCQQVQRCFADNSRLLSRASQKLLTLEWIKSYLQDSKNDYMYYSATGDLKIIAVRGLLRPPQAGVRGLVQCHVGRRRRAEGLVGRRRRASDACRRWRAPESYIYYQERPESYFALRGKQDKTKFSKFLVSNFWEMFTTGRNVWQNV